MEKAYLSHHILSRFNADLERVRTNVLQMGGLVEEQLANAVQALVNGDTAAADRVVQLLTVEPRVATGPQRLLAPGPRLHRSHRWLCRAGIAR